MFKCPYCTQPIKVKDLYRFDLTNKQKELYDRIVGSGIEGANINTIMSELDITSNTTLRTRVHGINKRIAPMYIIARGKSYRIERAEKEER